MIDSLTLAQAIIKDAQAPLVDPERAIEIRQFHIDLAQLQFRYGLKLETDGTFGITDVRRTMPQGYDLSAVIRADGRLEIIKWVPDL